MKAGDIPSTPIVEALAPQSSGWTDFTVDTGDDQRLSIDLFVCRGASSSPVALVIAGVHGDEYEGPTAIAELVRKLEPEALRGSVVAVPVANPPALRAAQRLSPLDGMNLARTFPGRNGGSPTERLGAALFDRLVRQSQYLIDLHSGGVEYLFLPLAGFYGGTDAANPCYQAARRFGFAALWQLPPTTGVLSYEAWKAGIVSVGTEYLGGGRLSAEGTACYTSGVLSCLAYWGILPDQPLPADGEVFTGDWELAILEGIFHSDCCLGDWVAPGEKLAEIVDTRGETRQILRASSHGRVLALRNKAWIRKGDWAVLVATSEPQRDR